MASKTKVKKKTKDKKIKTFSPSIDKTKNINVSKIPDTRKTSYTEKFKEIEDAKGFIETTMNVGVVLDVLSHKMYPSPESAMRELYMNAIRACQIAKEQYKAKPSILIVIDPINRGLIVHEFDSMGITFNEFNESLRVLGESTNFDRTKTGMMGMGFHAYVLISETIKVESFSRKEEQSMVLLGRRGKGFTNLTSKEEPTYNGQPMGSGVRLSLTYKEGVDPISLVNVIKSCAELNGIPTRIEVKDDIRKKGVNGQDLVEILQKKDVMECVLSNISDACTNSFKTDKKTRGINASVRDREVTYWIETEDYDVCGLVAIEKHRWNDNIDVCDRYGHIETKLCGVPIRNDIKDRFQKLLDKDITQTHDPEMFNWITINLKNEAKYPPITTREELSKENEVNLNELVNVVQELWKSYLTSIAFKSFKEYCRSKHDGGDGKAIIFDKFKTQIVGQRGEQGITDYERDLINAYNLNVVRYEGLYKNTSKSKLGEQVIKSNRTIFMKKLDKNRIHAIENKLNSLTIPNQMNKGYKHVQLTIDVDTDEDETKEIGLQGTYVNFSPKHYNEYQIESNIKLMQKFGIVIGDSMLKVKELKIKTTRAKRAVNMEREITWHTSQESIRTEGYRNDPMMRKDTITCTMDESNDLTHGLDLKTLLQLDTTTPMRMFTPLMHCLTNYAITKKRNGLDAVLSSVLIPNLKAKVLRTTRGDMTIQQILVHQGRVFMYAYDSPMIVDKIRDRLRDNGEAILRPNELVVVGSHDNIFEVMLVLVSNGVEYPFNRDTREENEFCLDFDFNRILMTDNNNHNLDFNHSYMPPFYMKLIELNTDHDLEMVDLVLQTQRGWINDYDELQALHDKIIQMEGRLRQ